MIYEYALEPELVASLTDRHECRHFKQSFGLERGRLVSRCPKNWKRLVWDAINGADDVTRKRIEELLAGLSERMVRRSDINWDDAPTSWLEKVEREHQRRPFHGILAQTNPRDQAAVMTRADMDGDDWEVSRGRSIPRNAHEMADAVAPLLRCSSEVIFVDPHFSPDKMRYRRPFECFLERMVHERPGQAPSRIEVHRNSLVTEEFFRGQCEARLPRCIPEGIPVRLRRLRQKTDGERLHNRYILTDLGGISFGTGLDEGEEGETDDLSLMDRAQYARRWYQYGRDDPPAGFNQDGATVEVSGTRTLPHWP